MGEKTELISKWKTAKKERRRRSWKCFWTWPWGHLWKLNRYRARWECLNCDKTADTIWGRNISDAS